MSVCWERNSLDSLTFSFDENIESRALLYHRVKRECARISQSSARISWRMASKEFLQVADIIADVHLG